LVPLDREVSKFCAEGTLVRTAIGDVQVETVADLVRYPCTLVDLADAEKAIGVETGDTGDILQGQALDVGEFFRSLKYESRLIALAAPILRC
jgi:hypothetical protein